MANGIADAASPGELRGFLEMENSLQRVNIGCGPAPTRGWLNFDNSLSVRLAHHSWLALVLARLGLLTDGQVNLVSAARSSGILWANAVRRIPVPDESVEALYTSHMMEHLDREEARLFLQEVYRVLALNGVVRIAVPDLRRLLDQYAIEGDADSFMEGTLLTRQRPRTVLDRLKYVMVGDRCHLWMYDGPSCCRLLLAMGFKKPGLHEPGSTMIAKPGELDLYERADESVYVEAFK